MIAINSFRNGSFSDSRPASMLQALESFILYELGFGGVITSLEPLTVETQVLHCQDITQFVGDDSEIQPLLAAAAVFFDGDVRGEMVDNIFRILPERLRTPLILQMAVPLGLRSRSRAALLIGAGVLQNELPATETIIRASNDDLMAALYLRAESGLPLNDIL